MNCKITQFNLAILKIFIRATKRPALHLKHTYALELILRLYKTSYRYKITTEERREVYISIELLFTYTETLKTWLPKFVAYQEKI